MSEKTSKKIHRTARKLVSEREPELIKQAAGKLVTLPLFKRLKFALRIIMGER